MSIINFPEFFTLEITHSYYNGRCRDFAFVLDETTRRLVRRGRLMLRERDGQLLVLYEQAEDGAPIASIAGESLHIGLRLVNKVFSNITQLPADVPPRSMAYANAPDARALSVIPSFVFAGELFTYRLASANRPADVVILKEGGAVAESKAVPAGQAEATFDLRGMPRGPFRVEERFNTQVTASDYYLDPEFRSADVFAVVHIKVDSGFYGAAPAFNIAFTARADRMRFYVLAEKHNATDLADLKVEDAGLVNPDLPPANVPPALVFNALSATDIDADRRAIALRAGSPDPLAVFESSVAVPRNQRAVRRLRLMRKDKELIANLRQPGAAQPDASLIIHVSKP